MGKIALLMLLATGSGFAADLCPASGTRDTGGVPGAVAWTSYRSEVRGKNCLGYEIRNLSGKPMILSWVQPGLDQVWPADRLEVAVCCFDGEEKRKTVLHYAGLHNVETGSDTQTVVHIPAEEGLAKHEEGYPDLMEEDARVRTVSIRGTLRMGDGETIRVDLLLKCSASKFAKQFAYQFSITDLSQDTVNVDWDPMTDMRAMISPSVQPIPNGKTYIFLSPKAPRERRSLVQLKTKSGQVAAIIGFSAWTAIPGF